MLKESAMCIVVYVWNVVNCMVVHLGGEHFNAYYVIVAIVLWHALMANMLPVFCSL